MAAESAWLDKSPPRIAQRLYHWPRPECTSLLMNRPYKVEPSAQLRIRSGSARLGFRDRWIREKRQSICVWMRRPSPAGLERATSPRTRLARENANYDQLHSETSCGENANGSLSLVDIPPNRSRDFSRARFSWRSRGELG
jgi:hypothetical protein